MNSLNHCHMLGVYWTKVDFDVIVQRVMDDFGFAVEFDWSQLAASITGSEAQDI